MESEKKARSSGAKSRRASYPIRWGLIYYASVSVRDNGLFFNWETY
jgi:hypothetical protein